MAQPAEHLRAVVPPPDGALAGPSLDAGLDSFHKAAIHILAARELEDALGGVTHEARELLDSDIAGVLLRQGDSIHMRGCVGHHRLETSLLVMNRGQGLAGLVFATGRPARVDNYIGSTTISNDFQSLARLEGTSCALGVPIVLDSDIIGVLEVWRRDERAYDDVDESRLLALADLAAIGLDNARLMDANREALVQIEKANERLSAQLSRVDQALALQHQLIDDLLAGRRVGELVTTLAQHTGLPVALFDGELEIVAAQPEPTPWMIDAVRTLTVGSASGPPTRSARRPDGQVTAHAVRIGDDTIGWLVVAVPAESGPADVGLALTQGALACALAQLQERTATDAQAAMREDMLLNLLTGGRDERRAAVARAKYVNIDLKGPLRVCLAHIELRDFASESFSDAAGADTVRRRLQRRIEQELSGSNVSRSLGALRGDTVVILVRADTAANLRDLLAGVSRAVVEDSPQARISWGVSGERTSPMELKDASHEATTALHVARSSSTTGVAVFDELGILGLVLSGPQGRNLQQFVDATIGPLIAHDRRRGSYLLLTLKTWLDCNCSQAETAETLYVHTKTVKYRLEQISKLTGLDLRQHKDRLRIDLAIRTFELA